MGQQKTLEDFFKYFPLQTTKKGVILLDPFNRPSGIYHLTEGYVRQFSISEQGKELTIHIYGPRTHFPMFWAYNLFPNRHYFQAITELQFHIVPKEAILSFFKTHPEVSIEFIKRLLTGIDGLTKRLEVNAFGDAQTKVISVLSYLAVHFGKQEGSHVHFHERFTHEQIATMTGLSREHVSLELEKLVTDRLIEFKNHRITLLDFQELTTKLPFS